MFLRALTHLLKTQWLRDQERGGSGKGAKVWPTHLDIFVGDFIGKSTKESWGNIPGVWTSEEEKSSAEWQWQ